MQEQFQQQQKLSQRDTKVDAILEMLVQDRAKSFQPNRLRVPELILPKFHGEIKAYKSFKDMFIHAIKDMDLSNTQLFVLLKSKLKGKALETIESLTLNDENYLRAWSALDTCFNNKRRLMDDCFEYVQSLDYKLEHANTDSIVNFHHKFRNLATNFEGLKTTTEFLDIQAHVYRGNTTPKDNSVKSKQQQRLPYNGYLPKIYFHEGRRPRTSSKRFKNMYGMSISKM